MNKRELQKIRTKENIIKVAIELIEAASFDDITINHICKKANVTKGAFYHHFDNKSDIVAEYYKLRVIDNFNLDKEAYVAKTSFEFMEEITFKFILLIHKQGLEFSKQIYKNQLENPLKYYVAKGETMERYLVDIIEEGQKKKEIRDDMDSSHLSKLILKFSRGLLYDWCINEGSYDFELEGKRDYHVFLQSYRYEAMKSE